MLDAVEEFKSFGIISRGTQGHSETNCNSKDLKRINYSRSALGNISKNSTPSPARNPQQL